MTSFMGRVILACSRLKKNKRQELFVYVQLARPAKKTQ
ncbi:hypothetical protein CKA32_005268 [Geitlerinema sp. FC II]|nr:hypothetical protein CKA32_005268 [Geitlerinema sp. FC II]